MFLPCNATIIIISHGMIITTLIIIIIIIAQKTVVFRINSTSGVRNISRGKARMKILRKSVIYQNTTTYYHMLIL